VDDRANARQITMHLLNYNVELGRDVDEMERVPTATVRLPLPQGFAPNRCRVIEVAAQLEASVTPRVADGVATLDLSDLGIHTVCVLE